MLAGIRNFILYKDIMAEPLKERDRAFDHEFPLGHERLLLAGCCLSQAAALGR